MFKNLNPDNKQNELVQKFEQEIARLKELLNKKEIALEKLTENKEIELEKAKEISELRSKNKISDDHINLMKKVENLKGEIRGKDAVIRGLRSDTEKLTDSIHTLNKTITNLNMAFVDVREESKKYFDTIMSFLKKEKETTNQHIDILEDKIMSIPTPADSSPENKNNLDQLSKLVTENNKKKLPNSEKE